ncbi:MAG: CueP family metal-binding protein [Spirochaeta sp.]|jgi:hypothetical protein|nr:CueP family metal-binding protein [Spirochaeta sp.]
MTARRKPRRGPIFALGGVAALLLMITAVFFVVSGEQGSPETATAAPAGTEEPTASSIETEQRQALRAMVPVDDARSALQLANQWRTVEPAVRTALAHDSIQFGFPDGTVKVVPIPGETMVVSIAPYVTTTHPCEIHSINGCQGELPDQEFDVAVTHTDGTEYRNETIQTGDNGFFELWLPAGSEFNVTVSGGGGTATRIIATEPDDRTCITDMQLVL